MVELYGELSQEGAWRGDFWVLGIWVDIFIW